MSRRHNKADKDRPYWPHSQDSVDVPRETPYLQGKTALDGTQACVNGCSVRGQHAPGCPCHAECPEHVGHCEGCAPRPAVGRSLLCGVCFHWRLRRPLKDMPFRYAWLGDQMGDGAVQSQRLDSKTTGSHETPIPINSAMFDLRVTMTLVLSAWADRVARSHVPAVAPPKRWDIGTTSKWLERRASWISQQAWVGVDSPDPAVRRLTLTGALRDLIYRADKLAPWQRQSTAVDLACPRCGHSTMVFFEGDDHITCTHEGCKYVLPWTRQRTLNKAIRKISAAREA
jgi:ribosomal protein S27E